MSYKIIIADMAKRDILDIYEYVSWKLKVPKTADILIQEIEKSIRNLKEMPERYRKFERISPEDIRIMPVKNYLVFYNVKSTEKIVEVIRVLYSKRKYDDLVFR